MYCFSNNIDFSYDWQLAYSQLYTHFNQLTSDYQKAIELGESLALKVQNIRKENEEIRVRKISKCFQTHTNHLANNQAIIPLSDQEITIRELPKSTPRIKKMQSIETSQDNNFQCMYHGCGRIYKSTVSMNLHIKVKHNGGTKKERQEHARAIFDAEERGEVPPTPPINFPPNFLEEFRTTYEYMKKYSM